MTARYISTEGKETITIPENPTKEGYTFDGWYWDNETWQTPFTANSLLDAPLSSDMSVYAKWKANEEQLQGTDMKSTLLTVGDETLTASFPNTTETFSFLKDIVVSKNAEYIVARDIFCESVISSKTVPLEPGDNTYYILITSGSMQKLYTVTIRRLPMYTVSFNSNGGTAVDSQTVEEGSLATEPTTSRIGYTFSSWSYDFTKPIISDTEINATWTPNTNTAYKVEYYLENLTKDGYELHLTDNLTGTTDTTAEATIKTFDHFTYNPNNTGNILSGSINGNGTFVLKVYYIRNTYTVNLSSSSHSKGTVYPYSLFRQPYGTEITATATSHPGYSFIGWFDGSNKLVSEEASYTFNISGNLDLVAEFEVKPEMAGFTFISTETTCKITGINDKTASEIVIPNGVTDIGYGVFRECLSLKSITIPYGVTNIDSSAFEGCISLKSITIPNSVTSIKSMAFYGCLNLESITLPNNIKKIDSMVFKGCSSLKSITIPNSVTTIDSYAFGDCKKLTQITIPDSVTSIGLSAFYGCSELTSVTLPNNITEIASFTFGSCSKLSSITIPEKVINIGQSAFSGCTSLKSINIPAKVIKIEIYAFRNCSSLTSVTFENTAGWKAGSTSISSSSLVDKSTAADYLRSTYDDYIWTRSE